MSKKVNFLDVRIEKRISYEGKEPLCSWENRPFRKLKLETGRERFVLVNGGCSSGKWLPRSEPVDVNNVNMAIATA